MKLPVGKSCGLLPGEIQNEGLIINVIILTWEVGSKRSEIFLGI